MKIIILLCSLFPTLASGGTVEEQEHALGQNRRLNTLAQQVIRTVTGARQSEQPDNLANLRNEINGVLVKMEQLGHERAKIRLAKDGDLVDPEYRAAYEKAKAIETEIADLWHRASELTIVLRNRCQNPGGWNSAAKTALDEYRAFRLTCKDLVLLDDIKDNVQMADALLADPNANIAEKKTDQKRPEIAKPKEHPATIFFLSDGRRLEARLAIESSDAWSIRTSEGKSIEIKKKEIEKIEKP